MPWAGEGRGAGARVEGRQQLRFYAYSQRFEDSAIC